MARSASGTNEIESLHRAQRAAQEAKRAAEQMAEFAHDLDAARLQAYISNPREFGNQVMPVYGETLSEEQLGQIAAFLEASKGSSGG